MPLAKAWKKIAFGSVWPRENIIDGNSNWLPPRSGTDVIPNPHMESKPNSRTKAREAIGYTIATIANIRMSLVFTVFMRVRCNLDFIQRCFTEIFRMKPGIEAAVVRVGHNTVPFHVRNCAEEQENLPVAERIRHLYRVVPRNEGYKAKFTWTLGHAVYFGLIFLAETAYSIVEAARSAFLGRADTGQVIVFLRDTASKTPSIPSSFSD